MHAFDWQTVGALAVVGVAGAWLLLAALRKRAKPGCGGDCGCPADEFKTRLAGKTSSKVGGASERSDTSLS